MDRLRRNARRTAVGVGPAGFLPAWGVFVERVAATTGGDHGGEKAVGLGRSQGDRGHLARPLRQICGVSALRVAEKTVGAALGGEPRLVPDGTLLPPAPLLQRDGGVLRDVNDERRRSHLLAVQLDVLPDGISPAFRLRLEGPASDVFRVFGKRRALTASSRVAGVAPVFPQIAGRHTVRVLQVLRAGAVEHVDPEMRFLALVGNRARLIGDVEPANPEPADRCGNRAGCVVIVQPGAQAALLGPAQVVDVRDQDHGGLVVGEDHGRGAKCVVRDNEARFRRHVRNPEMPPFPNSDLELRDGSQAGTAVRKAQVKVQIIDAAGDLERQPGGAVSGEVASSKVSRKSCCPSAPCAARLSKRQRLLLHITPA